MKLLYRFFVRLLAVGAILTVSCQKSQEEHARTNDSLLLNEAYAQTDTAAIRKNIQDLGDIRHTAITRAVAKVSPAVVGINVLQVRRIVQKSPFDVDDPFWRALFPELFRDRVYEQKVQSLGSGFLISSKGDLLTNEHVVEDAKEILVTMTNGKRYQAKIVGSDKVTDIALLKIEGDDFPFIEPGNSDDLLVGEWVIALGNPFGLFELNDKPTVTVGVISAVDRDWGRIPETGRLYMDMIQTDAAINHGNSGGPLVNSLGQVIGMNTFIFTGSRYQEGFVGIGFAIPINRIRQIAAELREKGSINRDYWLGILKVQDLNAYIIRALDLNVDHGAIITQIEPKSPAAKAGLKVEDVIIKVNGREISNSDDLVDTLSTLDLRVGDTLTFTVVRENNQLTFKVKLEELPK